MHAKTRDLLTSHWQSDANLSLFLFLLVVAGCVLPSIGFEKNHFALYADIVFSVLLIVGSAIAWENRTVLIATSLVAVLAIVVRWMAWWTPTKPLLRWSQSMGLVALAAIAAVLLWQVFRAGPVTVRRIEGAIAAYLCLGFAWAHAYHLLALVDPGAFAATSIVMSHPSSWANYSFGMLTTLGYQGITPIHPIAHTIGTFEAVTGQLYLAVLVARLVSMQVSKARIEHY